MPDEIATEPRAAPVTPEIAVRQISLASYVALVNRCAGNRLNQEISNGSPFHARILISKLFEIARKRVQIVTGSLTEETSDGIQIYALPEIIEQAKRFLRDPNAYLSIVVQSGRISGGEGNKFLKQVIEDKARNGTVELLIATPGAMSENIPHFMLSDAEAYRFEPGKDAQPKNRTITAIANFGDVSFAQKLESYFKSLIGHVEATSFFVLHRVTFPPTNNAFALPPN